MTDFWNDAVIYALDPRTFFDSNGDGTGDFRGVQQRLCYLEELGCTALLLSLETESARQGLDDLRRLCAAAHRRSMRVLFCRVPEPICDGESIARAISDGVLVSLLDLGGDGFLLRVPDAPGPALDACDRVRRALLDRDGRGTDLISIWGRPDRSLRAGFSFDVLPPLPGTPYEALWSRPGCCFSRQAQTGAAAFFRDYLQRAAAGGVSGLASGGSGTARMSGFLSQEEQKLAFAFLFSMPGLPFLYAGDEIGLRDPRWREGPQVLTPMQWSGEKNAGFSSAARERLILPIDPDENRPTAERQLRDEGSLLQTVRRLIALRRATPALQRDGGFELLYCREEPGPILYRRRGPEGSVLVALNPADRPCLCPCAGSPGRALFRLGGRPELRGDALAMPPGSAAFYREE